MIKNILFDFGAVLIPIEEDETRKAFKELGAQKDLALQTELFHKFEKGEISNDTFLTSLQAFFFRKTILKKDLEKAWSALCSKEIPSQNIRMIKRMAKDYSCFLLSNTNALHLEKIRDNSGRFNYNQFMKSFKACYLSHEMGARKPEGSFYKRVLDEQALEAEECLFIDDREENIEAAIALGFKTWHFDPKKDSILSLAKKLKEIVA